jgi:hypothetical protein
VGIEKSLLNIGLSAVINLYPAFTGFTLGSIFKRGFMNHISNNGFIVLHRKMVDWEWYQDANTMRLFLHCILKANHKTKKWQGIDIQRGQFLTSSDTLALDLKLSRQQIRTSLNKLKSTSEITILTTSRNSMITVSLYNDYQDKKQSSTNEQPSSNHQVTTTNNVNNENTQSESKIPVCPHDKIIDLYHKILPELQGVNKTLWKGSKREKDLSSRWKQNEEFRKGEFWDWFFKNVRTSNHHMGGSEGGWKAELGWLVKKENFIKLVERFSS